MVGAFGDVVLGTRSRRPVQAHADEDDAEGIMPTWRDASRVAARVGFGKCSLRAYFFLAAVCGFPRGRKWGTCAMNYRRSGKLSSFIPYEFANRRIGPLDL